MNILGINAYFHDSAACLLRDGELVMHVEEERLNREKHTSRFPALAIESCLRAGRIDIHQVDAVAINWNVLRGLAAKAGVLMRHLPRSINLLRRDASRHSSALSHMASLGLRRTLRQHGLPSRVPIHRVDHHLSHAACGFLASPYEEAAILTLDAAGDDCATATFAGRDIRIEWLSKSRLLDSLGLAYSMFTQYLGFRPLFDEGKVMALAALGTPRYLDTFRRVVKPGNGGDYHLDLTYFRFQYAGAREPFSAKLYEELGPGRTADMALDDRHYDIAASLQARLEEVVIGIAARLRTAVGSENICLAGGVALNCLCNGRVLREAGFRQLFVPPVPNDSGGALGAALWVNHCRQGQPRKLVLNHANWGPAFDDLDIERALNEHGLPFQRIADSATTGAEIIAAGGILGWFQGRMEIGPRALGNRSILADPRRAEMKHVLNARIKHRESFRPFSPSVLAESAHEYFELDQPSPFMMLAARSRPVTRHLIPAVVHVDGTARVHTVRREDNPRYWSLISAFQALTGVPMVLNTSFNENEPIVCTPGDAARCFVRTPMDALILGDYLVSRRAGAPGVASA